MSVGARYGFCLGVAISTLQFLVPQPLGAVLLHSALALQLAIGAVLVWRRMGMPYFTATLVLGSCSLALMAYLFAQGHELLSLPLAWAVLLVGLFASEALLAILEKRVNARKWEAWRAFMQDKSVLDMLLMRHIPVLRSNA